MHLNLLFGSYLQCNTLNVKRKNNILLPDPRQYFSIVLSLEFLSNGVSKYTWRGYMLANT